ncbi:recombinase family protein [uncultured Jatrophihabitans sp.]|uniref:recombinase family protein n=1 Tax=uncultured Jatrophihabitans sp. TaxID=1610747 RepID=UPI0035CC0124
MASRTKTRRQSKLALLYIRVSTADQVDEGASLATQTATLLAEAERRGWDVEIVADEGLSGATIAKRPQLTLALDRLDRGEADVLLAQRVDRLSRSVADFAQLMDRAKRKRWQLVALDLGVDTSTPAGDLMANVLASVAQYERKIISQRTREVMTQRKREGWPNGSPGPTSKLSTRTERLIVGMADEGWSLRKIADELNKRNVPTATGKIGAWYASTVRQILIRAQ